MGRNTGFATRLILTVAASKVLQCKSPRGRYQLNGTDFGEAGWDEEWLEGSSVGSLSCFLVSRESRPNTHPKLPSAIHILEVAPKQKNLLLVTRFLDYTFSG